jgi:signal transduction histidine kinase
VKNLTIKIKITLWYALFLLVLLSIFSVFLFFTISELLYRSNEDLLKADTGQVMSILQVEGNDIRLQQPYKIMTTNTYFVVFDSSGNANADSEILPQLVNIPIEEMQVRYITIDGIKWAVYDEPISINNMVLGWVRVSRSMESVVKTLNNLKLIIFISIPLYILFASLGGLFLADRALRPIDDITKTASKISKGDLKRRLKKPAKKDEIGRLVVTFNEMLDKLESFIKKEQRFTSDVSHELRTPLAVISAQAEQLLSGLPKKSEGRDNLRKILKESKKMSYVVSQLLMLYRSEEGEYKLNYEVLDLNMIGEEIINEYKDNTKDKGINIELETESNIKIKADQTLITRLMVNLIDNAIRYSRKKSKITMSLMQENDQAVIAVKDNGMGIAEEDMPYIFDRFYQADKSRGNQGTGLGLSIVKWIAEVHNGDIEVESEVNKGSRFIVKLPLNISEDQD